MNFAKFEADPKSFGPSPKEVMRAATDNPYASKCIEMWRNGKCAWEEALAAALVAIVAMVDYVLEDPLRRRKVTPDTSVEHPQPVRPS